MKQYVVDHAHAVRKSFTSFFFEARDLRPLDLMRIVLGITMLCQFGFLSPHALEYYGHRGWAPVSVAWPWIDWPFLDSVFLHLPSDVAVLAVYGLFLAAVAMFTVGFQMQWVKIVVWYLHLALFFRNQEVIYGADRMVNCVLFLLVLAPLGRFYAVDAWYRKARGKPDYADDGMLGRERASMVLRLVQIQLAVIYLFAGLAKLKHDHWWHGHAIWRAFVNPEFGGESMAKALAHVYWIGNLMTYTTLVVEVSYPYMIWNAKRRLPILVGIIGMHAGIAILMKLFYFSSVMIAANLTFLTPTGVDKVEAAARWVLRRGRTPTSLPPPRDTPSPREQPTAA